MTGRFLFILFLILTACGSKFDEKKGSSPFGRRTSYKTTDLTAIFKRVIKKLDQDIHGVSFLSNDGIAVSRDTLRSLLYSITRRDLTNKSGYETYIRTCDNIDFLTWQSKTHKNLVTRIDRIDFNASILLSDGSKNSVVITDFDIYSITRPNHIAVRVIDDYDLGYLKMDEVEYKRFAESISAGLDIAIAKVNKAKKNLCR